MSGFRGQRNRLSGFLDNADLRRNTPDTYDSITGDLENSVE